MKLVIQIPCLNEEKTLPAVLKDLPAKIPGISNIDILIIDDGSTDKTVAIAKKLGVKHFVYHRQRQGLARGFNDGVTRALAMGADIVVNTDGDHQYPGRYIKDLVKPIVQGKADLVIADRQTATIDHFSPVKKLLQRFGTWVLNKASGTNIPDAPSGFRAYSREAILRLNVITRFSYTMETVVQAGNKGLAITSIPITVNPKTRESRLFKNNWEHVRKSGAAIIRAFIMYRPLIVFVSLGLFLLALGLVPFVRFWFLVAVQHEYGTRHLQSLIAGSVMVVAAVTMLALGVIADLIRINRTLIESSLEQQKRTMFKK